MSTARRLHYSYAEYLDVERMSSVKHEFLDGEIYAMAGGTPEHSRLATRVTTLLETHLSGCATFNSDLKINVMATGLSTYPDGSVVCGSLVRDPKDELAVTNPTILVEVTSKSTEDYDRGDKLSHYKQVDSLKAVLIVAHAAKRITAVVRSENGWLTTDYRAGERLHLPVPPIELGVDEVYAALDGLSAVGG